AAAPGPARSRSTACPEPERPNDECACASPSNCDGKWGKGFVLRREDAALVLEAVALLRGPGVRRREHADVLEARALCRRAQVARRRQPAGVGKVGRGLDGAVGGAA